ncbi:MAG: hypothetical protein H8M99_14305 [Gloeobacteraceae cyanobacterium ES-bin-144]|nr:hypothetical protein [Verrucomicrobiales bacterium]
MIKKHLSPLWVITSYYNPQGYQRRRQNFLAFKKNLNLPLMVVELAEEGRHQLNENSADRVIRLTGDSFIWQKERLLNIAIEHLPAHVKYVAWVDCDMKFERDDWADEAVSKLEKNGGLVQLFGKVIHCPQAFNPLKDSISSIENLHLFTERSSGMIAAQGDYQLKTGVFSRVKTPPPDAGDVIIETVGHAWAACVSDLSKVKIYDANIIGGGDSIMFSCAVGVIDGYLKKRDYTEKHQEHIHVWQKNASEHGLFRQVDYVGGNLYHYWHGDFKHRRYNQRIEILKSFDYDPETDLCLASNGTWAWANPHGGLADSVRRYFLSRCEDGLHEACSSDAISS